MKSNLAIALLASAAQAQQDVSSVAQHMDYNTYGRGRQMQYYERDLPAPRHYREVDYYNPYVERVSSPYRTHQAMPYSPYERSQYSRQPGYGDYGYLEHQRAYKPRHQQDVHQRGEYMYHPSYGANYAPEDNRYGSPTNGKSPKGKSPKAKSPKGKSPKAKSPARGGKSPKGKSPGPKSPARGGKSPKGKSPGPKSPARGGKSPKAGKSPQKPQQPAKDQRGRSPQKGKKSPPKDKGGKSPEGHREDGGRKGKSPHKDTRPGLSPRVRHRGSPHPERRSHKSPAEHDKKGGSPHKDRPHGGGDKRPQSVDKQPSKVKYQRDEDQQRAPQKPVQPEHKKKQPERQPKRQPERQPERQPQRQPERQPERQPKRQPERQPERQPQRQPERQPERQPKRQRTPEKRKPASTPAQPAYVEKTITEYLDPPKPAPRRRQPSPQPQKYKQPEYKQPEYKQPEYKQPEYKQPEYKPEYQKAKPQPYKPQPAYPQPVPQPQYKKPQPQPRPQPQYQQPQPQYQQPQPQPQYQQPQPQPYRPQPQRLPQPAPYQPIYQPQYGGHEAFVPQIPVPSHYGIAPQARTLGMPVAQVTHPYSGEVQGYDRFGRPIYRPISPYDHPQTTAHKTHDPDVFSQEHALGHQPDHSLDQPAELPGQHHDPTGADVHAEQHVMREQHSPLSQPQHSIPMSLAPLYGQTMDPYSEIGFPQQQGYAMNPYMQKKQMKAYYKQQKFMAKYGGMGAGMPMGMGYQQSNDINGWNDQEHFSGDDEDNVLGIVHPSHEGSDIVDKAVTQDFEYVQDQGRQFAILDWPEDKSMTRPAPEAQEDEEEDEPAEIVQELAPEVTPTEAQDSYEVDEEAPKKKHKKDKKMKKDKKHKKEKPVRRGEFGDFEDHFGYDIGTGDDEYDSEYGDEYDDEEDDQGRPPAFEYFDDGKQRYLYDGDESKDHYGYNNSGENDLMGGRRSRRHHEQPHYNQEDGLFQDKHSYYEGQEHLAAQKYYHQPHQTDHGKDHRHHHLGVGGPHEELEWPGDGYHTQHVASDYPHHGMTKDEHKSAEKKHEKARIHDIQDEKAYVEEEFVHRQEWEDFSDDSDQEFDRKRYQTMYEEEDKRAEQLYEQEKQKEEKLYEQERQEAEKHHQYDEQHSTYAAYDHHRDQHQHHTDTYDLSPLEEIDHLYRDHPHAREHSAAEQDHHFDYGYDHYWTEGAAKAHHDTPRDFDHDTEEKLWYQQQQQSEQEQRKPSDRDFYTFGYDDIHEEPLRQTHLSPMPEHGTWESLRHSEEQTHRVPSDFREHIFGEERPFEQSHYDMYAESRHHDDRRGLDLDMPMPRFEAVTPHHKAEAEQKKSKKSEKKTAAPAAKAKKTAAPAAKAKKPAAKKANSDDLYYDDGDRYYSDDDGDRYHSDYDESSDDEYPVYPYEASIFYDVANGYDIYYDPLYESPFDTEVYDEKYLDSSPHHYYTQEEDSAVPYARRDHGYAPRSHRRNDMENETPMYVRPYLEDPIFLQPDDYEVEMLHHSDESTKHSTSDHHVEFSDEEEDHEETTHGENGFRHTGDKCLHDFECISGKCMSWLDKAPVCMPF